MIEEGCPGLWVLAVPCSDSDTLDQVGQDQAYGVVCPAQWWMGMYRLL